MKHTPSARSVTLKVVALSPLPTFIEILPTLKPVLTPGLTDTTAEAVLLVAGVSALVTALALAASIIFDGVKLLRARSLTGSRPSEPPPMAHSNAAAEPVVLDQCRIHYQRDLGIKKALGIFLAFAATVHLLLVWSALAGETEHFMGLERQGDAILLSAGLVTLVAVGFMVAGFRCLSTGNHGQGTTSSNPVQHSHSGEIPSPSTEP